MSATQQTLTGWNRSPYSATFNALSFVRFQQVSPSSAVANTTVQSEVILPGLFKIRKVGVSFTAIDNIAGDDLFNIVVGAGSYSTAGVEASDVITVGGTWAQNDTATVTIAGHAVVATITQASPSLANVATDIAAAIVADSTSNLIVTAAAGATTVTVTALVPGTGGNAITITVAKSSTSGTISSAHATLVNGANESGVTIAPNDNSFSSGTAAPQANTTNGAGLAVSSSGLGYPTNVAAAGMAVFSSDIPFVVGANPAGSFQPPTGYTMTYAPGFIAVAVSTGGYGVFVPANYDAVYPGLLPITLRCQTAAVSGSISNLSVVMQIEALTPIAEPGSLNYPIPGISW